MEFLLRTSFTIIPFSCYYNQETVDLLIPADQLNWLALDFSFVNHAVLISLPYF